MKKHIAFTICTSNYLAGAIVWRRTLAEAKTNIRGLIYVVDIEADQLQSLCNEVVKIAPQYADKIEKDLRCLSANEIPDELELRERYQVIEYCTAIKPSVFLSLANEFSEHIIHYFDPDIAVYGNLDKLKDLSEKHSFILTPHMTSPTEDNFKLTQLDILRAGIFNFGYLGWNPSFSSGWPLIRWWQRRLNRDCRVALSEGIFTDQSWGAFFCSSPDSGILYDAEFNVAYWNLHERLIEWTDSSEATCNGEKLQFFHFSGYSPFSPEKLSLHQDRHHLAGLRGLKRLCFEYSEQLQSAGFIHWKKKPSVLKQIINKSISGIDKNRRPKTLLKDSASQCIYSAFKDPNKSRLLYGVCWWFVYGMLYITHKLSNKTNQNIKPNGHVVAEKQISNFHNSQSLIKKGLIYWGIRIKEGLINLFNRKSDRGPEKKLNKSRLNTDNALSDSENHPNSSTLLKSIITKDIAVVGYITAETGLGESVRGIIRSLDRANLEVDLYDIRRHYARKMDEEFSGRIRNSSGPVPKYKACLMHVNADQVPHMLKEIDGSLLTMADRRIGYWYWETETLPNGQAAAANYFDEIWVATEFVREALTNSGVKTPVKVIPPAHSALPDVPYGRSHFDLPEDRRICLCVFDATSFLGRKNPGAAIKALKKLYTDNEITPLLVLKTTNLKNADREELFRLAGQVDVHIINKYLSREETLSLVSLSDCFISLHRAEGLGLSLIDAMRLNTPLVCTNYSGPKDFVNDDNAFLVPWKYCQALWEDGPYFGSRWADPDIEIAAQQIRSVIAGGEVVQKRIKAAKKNAEHYFSRERIADLVTKTCINKEYNIGK